MQYALALPTSRRPSPAPRGVEDSVGDGAGLREKSSHDLGEPRQERLESYQQPLGSSGQVSARLYATQTAPSKSAS